MGLTIARYTRKVIYVLIASSKCSLKETLETAFISIISLIATLILSCIDENINYQPKL